MSVIAATEGMFMQIELSENHHALSIKRKTAEILKLFQYARPNARTECSPCIAIFVLRKTGLDCSYHLPFVNATTLWVIWCIPIPLMPPMKKHSSNWQTSPLVSLILWALLQSFILHSRSLFRTMGPPDHYGLTGYEKITKKNCRHLAWREHISLLVR